MNQHIIKVYKDKNENISVLFAASESASLSWNSGITFICKNCVRRRYLPNSKHVYITQVPHPCRRVRAIKLPIIRVDWAISDLGRDILRYLRKHIKILSPNSWKKEVHFPNEIDRCWIIYGEFSKCNFKSKYLLCS